MTRFLLAVDPGPSTGVAWYDLENEEFLGAKVMRREEFEDAAETAIALKDIVVVCEKFVITAATAKKVRYNDSIEIIGFLRFLCRRHQRKLIEYSASDAKSFVTNEKLKALKMYTRNDHARDATRHLVLYLVRHKLIDIRPLLEEAS